MKKAQPVKWGTIERKEELAPPPSTLLTFLIFFLIFFVYLFVGLFDNLFDNLFVDLFHLSFCLF